MSESQESKRRAARTDSRLGRTAYGWSALLMALPFVAAGGYFTLAGLAVVPLPGKANAPLWVIAAVGVAFGLGGLVLLGYALRGLLARRRAAGLRRRHGHQPWLLDYPWDPAGVADAPAERWLHALIMLLVFAALMTPLNWLAFFAGRAILPLQLFAGLFDLILLFVALAFLHRLAQFLKFGYSRLSFAHFPFAPGERLRVGFSPNRFDELEVTLRFVEEWFESDGRSTRAVSAVRYREGARVQPDPRAAEVPLAFDLPDNPDWVDRLTADPGIRYWELEVASHQPGVDFRTSFPLPVYDRPGSPTVVRPRRPRKAARRLAYGFELGLPLLLVALLGGAWWLWPGEVARVGERLTGAVERVRLARLLEADADINSSAMAVGRAQDGAVWALSKYEVVRYARDERELLLDSRRYRELFGHKPNALSALWVSGPREAWVGSWYGELFHIQGDGWREVSGRDAPLGRRIHALAAQGGRVWLAGQDGLWRWDPEAGMQRVVEVDSGVAGAVTAGRDGRVYAGVGHTLWRLQWGAWDRLWEGDRGERVTALALADDGGLWVGTRAGLVRLDRDGRPLHRSLEGRHITAIHPQGERLWVGTWKDGLHVGRPGAWQVLDEAGGLPKNSVSGVAVDGDGAVYVTVYGGGVLRTSAAALLERLGGVR